MTTTKTYRDVIVWQKAMLLVNKVYKISANFPETEKYALISQVRKSAISIPSSIAKGYRRRTTKSYVRFLNIATGSLFELQTQIEIALSQDYLNKEIFDLIYEDSREIDQMLNSLIQKLN